MATPLIPQEIYLLERYTSVEYFGDMRDAWAAMIDVAERALDAFEKKLPANYRKRPLYNQPDIVWGERVLVNFRSTRDNLNRKFIGLTHGEFNALVGANGVSNDATGFQRDYSSDWMDEPNVSAVLPNANEEFWRLLGQARMRASIIEATFYAQWNVGNLSSRYVGARGPLNPPAEWPTYRLDPKVRVLTGTPTPQTGIYLPDADDSAPAFMIEGRSAHQATIGYDPKRMQNVSEAPSWWRLVERACDTGGGVPGALDAAAGIRLRCEGGQPCPREGFWFTPAKPGSRRRFQQGELMPVFSTDYGATIWQWDAVQD